MKHVYCASLIALSVCSLSAKTSVKSSRVVEFQATRSASSLEAFEQRIAEGSVIVDFYALQCGPCNRIAPIFNELAGKYTNVSFIKVNIDDHKEIATKYNIRSIPQLLFFQNGKLVKTIVGQQSKDYITRALNTHFNG